LKPAEWRNCRAADLADWSGGDHLVAFACLQDLPNVCQCNALAVSAVVPRLDVNLLVVLLQLRLRLLSRSDT
jgi:hypothetical protein